MARTTGTKVELVNNFRATPIFIKLLLTPKVSNKEMKSVVTPITWEMNYKPYLLKQRIIQEVLNPSGIKNPNNEKIYEFNRKYLNFLINDIYFKDYNKYNSYLLNTIKKLNEEFNQVVLKIKKHQEMKKDAKLYILQKDSIKRKLQELKKNFKNISNKEMLLSVHKGAKFLTAELSTSVANELMYQFLQKIGYKKLNYSFTDLVRHLMYGIGKHFDEAYVYIRKRKDKIYHDLQARKEGESLWIEDTDLLLLVDLCNIFYDISVCNSKLKMNEDLVLIAKEIFGEVTKHHNYIIEGKFTPDRLMKLVKKGVKVGK